MEIKWVLRAQLYKKRTFGRVWFYFIKIVDSLEVLLLFVIWILIHYIFLCAITLGSCRCIELIAFRIAFEKKLKIAS